MLSNDVVKLFEVVENELLTYSSYVDNDVFHTEWALSKVFSD